MSNVDRDTAISLMRSQRYEDAFGAFQELLADDPSDWSLYYMAGQCARFTNQDAQTITLLTHAAKLNSQEPQVFLALGIALQRVNRLKDAENALRKALELNPDMETAYNSLALTQKMMGQLDLAVYNYNAGIKALSRRIVNAMVSIPEKKIYNHPTVRGTLWAGYAIFGAMFLCASEPKVTKIAWPTGEEAEKDVTTQGHRGLYWRDIPDSKGVTRLFLPNYFNTFCALLQKESSYANLLGNRGTVLEMMGKQSEAQAHFAEANEFVPQ